MLIALKSGTVINLKTIKSMAVSYTPKITKSSGFFFGLFGPGKDLEEPNYTLRLDYVSGADNKDWFFTCSSKNRDALTKVAQEIITQVKQFDSSLVDKAFEDAFLKG